MLKFYRKKGIVNEMRRASTLMHRPGTCRGETAFAIVTLCLIFSTRSDLRDPSRSSIAWHGKWYSQLGSPVSLQPRPPIKS